MEVGTYLVAHAQSFELMQPGEGPLDDPSGPAQPRTVRGAAAGDLRCDPPTAAAVAVHLCTASNRRLLRDLAGLLAVSSMPPLCLEHYPPPAVLLRMDGENSDQPGFHSSRDGIRAAGSAAKCRA